MAFVIAKAQKNSIFDPKKQVIEKPGPGQYSSIVNNYNKPQYCAPFNTSQIKVSSFDVVKTNYGPGSYQPKYHKDLNKVKSNEGYIFQSKVQRFDSKDKKASIQKDKKQVQKQLSRIKKSQVIQPSLNHSKSQFNNTKTNYSFTVSNKANAKEKYAQKLQKNKSLMQQIRQHNRQKRIQSIKGKRQFIRVILTSSNNTQNIQSRYIYRNIKGKTLGPGSYQNVNFKPKSKSVTKWNLDKNNRFKTEPSIAPGPGAYNIAQQSQQNITQFLKTANTQLVSRKKKDKPSASFASTVIRSHMDTIIYRTNIPIKAAILQDRRLKDTKPGPGTYNTSLSYKQKKSFNFGGQNNFGSSSRVNNLYQQQPGPGYYNINLRKNNRNQCNQIIKQVRAQIFGKKGRIAENFNKNNSLSRSYSHKISGVDPSFSNPNSYREQKQRRIAKFCSLQQRCFSKLGNMSQEQRFKQQQLKMQGILPGPGQYHNQRLVSSLSCHEIDYKGNSVFKSQTDRDPFINRNVSDTPFYNIIRNDIGFKAQKARKYIENLKKINIDKTPFQTGQKRFRQNVEQLNQSGIISPTKHQISLQKVLQQRKPKQQSSNFKSNTKRQVFKSEPRPGPGDYTVKVKSNGAYQSIQKKSFNKYYGLNKLQLEQQKVNHSGGFSILSRKNSNHNRKKNNQTMLQNKNQQIMLQNKPLSSIEPDIQISLNK